MITKDIVYAYLRLLRLHSAASESALVILGAIIMGQQNYNLLFILFIIGIFYHIYGFVLNDYADIEVDKKSSDLLKKPLVSGIIPKKKALMISLIAGGCTYILALLFFWGFPLALVLLTLALVLGAVYDFYGKIISGGFSDFIIAGSLSFIFLFGAATYSMELTPLILIIGLMIFFAIVFANAVEGGLKDVDHDYSIGANTLATRMGVIVMKGRLYISRSFMIFSYTIIGICFLLIILLGFQPEINIWHSNDFIKLSILTFLIIIMFIYSYKLMSLKIFDRSKIKRYYAILNLSAGATLLVFLFPIIGLLNLLILLIIPILWYVSFNLIFYGKPFQPEV